VTRLSLPLRALREALGELDAGVYALTGPVGCGKTQLALQIAASCTEPLLLVSPRIDPREIRARLEGIRRRAPWTLEEAPNLPASIELTHAFPGEGRVIVVDHFSEDPEVLLSRARRAAIDRDAIVLVVLEPRNAETVKTFVPHQILRRSPPEIAEWIGVSARAAAEVDALVVLAPDRPRSDAGWNSIELAVAKHRRGVPARTVLRFNGAWFEDEAGELDLGI
jgi:hypothetical protein